MGTTQVERIGVGRAGTTEEGHLFLLHGLAALSGHGARLVTGLFLAPFVIAHIGQEGYGLMVMVAALLPFLSLLQVGVPQAAIRFLAERIGDPQRAEVGEIYSSAVAVLAVMGLVAGGAVTWLAFHPAVLGHAGAVHAAGEVAAVVAVLGAATALGMPLMLGDSILIAKRQMVAHAAIQTALTLLRVPVVVVALALWQQGLVAYAAITAAFTLLTFGAGLLWQARTPPRLRFVPGQVRLAAIRLLLGHGRAVLATTVGLLLTANVTYFLVGRYLGAKELAFFSLALVWSTLFQGASTSVSQVLMATAANKAARGESAWLGELVVRASRYLFLGAMPLLIFLVTFRVELVRVWLGSGFETTAALMLPVLVAEGFTVLNAPAATIVGVTGMARRVAWWNVVLAAALAGVLWWGLRNEGWGLPAVGLVYAVGAVLKGALLYPAVVAASLRLSLARYLRRIHLRSLGAFLLALALVRVLPLAGLPEGWTGLVLRGLCALVVCAAVGYLFALDTHDRRRLAGSAGRLRRALAAE